MSAPDPESFGYLGKALGALAVVGTTIVAPLWMARNWLDKRFATKHNLRDAVQPLVNQQTEHRALLSRLDEKVDQAETRNEERHRELLMHLLRKPGD